MLVIRSLLGYISKWTKEFRSSGGARLRRKRCRTPPDPTMISFLTSDCSVLHDNHGIDVQPDRPDCKSLERSAFLRRIAVRRLGFVLYAVELFQAQKNNRQTFCIDGR